MSPWSGRSAETGLVARSCGSGGVVARVAERFVWFSPSPVVLVLGLGCLLFGAAWVMERRTYNLWAGFWVGAVLLLLSFAVAHRAALVDDDRRIGRLVMAAAAVKIIGGSLVRYQVVFGLYGGTADAGVYHRVGALLAPQLRHGDYSQLGPITGTRFIGVLTGQIYALTGVTRVGGFMVFSWLAFVGLYLFYRAFRTSCPDGDHFRYALLVFFVPSLVFWPSSIGKEAFMVLVLGAAALGAAQLFAGRLQGVVWLGLGLWGATVVRPHLTLITVGSLLVAALVAVARGGPRRHQLGRGRLGGAVLVVGLLVTASTFVGATEHFFHLQSLNAQSAQDVLETTNRQTGALGTTFHTISPNNPVGFVLATGSVLFRPLPFEAHNAPGLVSGIESLVLLGLACLSWRRLVRLPAEVVRRPYVAFAVAYAFAFAYAFSSVANYGILARERVQLLPVLFVLVCLPLPAPATPTEIESESGDRERAPEAAGP